MFCEKCGSKLLDTADFCTNCGNSVVKSAKVAERNIVDTEIQLKVKPTFKFGYMVALPSLILYSALIIIFSFVFCTMSVIAGIIIALICFMLLALTTVINKKQYDSCSYEFYKTKVIYKSGFLNSFEKEVKYKYIREVVMCQTFVQRYFNIGNIALLTNAETGGAGGVVLANIEDIDNVYKQIKEIIKV